MSPPGAATVALDAVPWETLRSDLDERGFATLGPLLSPHECRALAALYDEERHFRSRVIMARHGFGRGEYRYFDYPLPPPAQALREGIYPQLVAIANRWYERMGLEPRFPGRLDEWLRRCHAAGQPRATPLLLRYGAGDYNCLHQDLYGEHLFPLQLTVLLDAPGEDFDGGEFVITEQRPRMQSRASVVPLRQGSGVIFAVNQRPRAGTRGDYRVRMRHGVSTVRRGQRHALGIIFHDAA